MKKRTESDASLLIGLILGAAVGSALVVIMSADPEEKLNFPILNTGNSINSTHSGIVTNARDTATPTASSANVQKARRALEENDEERTEGAAEGAAR